MSHTETDNWVSTTIHCGGDPLSCSEGKVTEHGKMDKRTVPMWYPMRVTYGREETVKKNLDDDHVINFLPMHREVFADGKGRPHQRLVPAVRNLVFIHSTRNAINDMKMFRKEYKALRYMIDRTAESLDDNILTVPERQMKNFLRVASVEDDRVMPLEYNAEFLTKPGKRVRIIAGDFQGVEGVVKRIRKNKHVVVELKGVAAIAIAFVPSAWLEELPD